MSVYADTPDIPALYNVVDLQRICQQQKIKLSSDTNRYLLYITLRKIGAVQAQKLIKKLVDRGEIKWEDDESFEVEAVLNYSKDDQGKEFYEIKWKGWSMQHNTWEPKENVQSCKELLEDFHQIFDKYGKEGVLRAQEFDLGHKTKHSKLQYLMDKIMDTQELTAAKLLTVQSPNKNIVKRLQKRAIRKTNTVNITNKRSKAYRQLKAAQQKRLKEWEVTINKVNTDPAPIFVLNNVDLEGPPSQFTYINDYKAMPGIDIPEDPIVGCECTNCVETKKQCCGPNAGAEYAYFKNKRVRVPPGHPIYECNKRCGCDPSCCNRVVQQGRKHKVTIFRTSNGRGWGVKAMQKIPKGSFVMEYVGEVITFEEAEARGKVYDAEGMTYLFDLDYNDGDCPYTVDARSYGNVSHFVNHSCDPNLAVYGVWINTLDPRLPRIALFAKKDITKDEELTFDYMMTGVTEESDLMPEKDVDEISTCTTESVTNSNKENTESTSSSENLPMDVDVKSTPVKSTPVKVNTEAKSLEDSKDTAVSSGLTENKEDVDNNKTPSKVQNGVLNEKTVNIHVVTSGVTEISNVTPNALFVTPTKVSSRMGFSPSPRKEEGSRSAERNALKNRRSVHCPPAMKYRLMCQCGAATCRKYLY